MDDLAVPQHHRSGAHRARRHPLLTVLASLAAVAVFSGVLLWALLSLDVLGAGERLDRGLGSPTAGAVATDPASPGAEGTAVADASPEPTADSGAEATADATADATAGATAEATAGATAEATDGAATQAPDVSPEVDRTVGVDVLNSTSTPGLAAGAAEVLAGEGWTIGEVANYGEGEVPTTVLHPSEDLEATAAAVADDLGVGVVEQSGDVSVVTVVLGADYSG